MNIVKIAICLPIWGVIGSTDSTTSCFIDCYDRVDSDGYFQPSFNDCSVDDDNISEFQACLDDAGRDSIKIIDFALISNYITELPDDFFSGMTSVESMIFRFYSLEEEIPLGLFQPLTSLEILEFHDLQVDIIQSGIFDGLGVKQLILKVYYDNQDSSDEKTLPSGLLNNMNSLEELFVGYEIDSLPEGFFDGLTSLKDLEIFGNLRYLPDGIFDDLSSVEFLDLSHNDLIDLSPSIFSNMDSLLELDLSGNYLACYPDSQAREIEVDEGVEVCDEEDVEHGLTENEDNDGNEDNDENEGIFDSDSSESTIVFPFFSCTILSGIISITMM